MSDGRSGRLARAIDPLTRASLRRPALFLALAAAVAGAGAWLASGLEIRSSFEELLPADVPSVRHAKELVKRVGGDGTVLVNVESLEGPPGLGRAEALAARLADEYRALGPSVIRSVESNLLPVERWYADHWPLFLPLADLVQARDRLAAEVKSAKQSANPFLFPELEEKPKAPPPKLPELLSPDKPSPRGQVLERFARYPDGFMVHPDHRSVTIVVRPAGTSLGIDAARALLERMRAIADRHRPEMEAGRLRVGFAGTFPILLNEYTAILHDVFSTFLLCVALILASIILFYRELRSTLALGLAILVAIATTFGFTRLAIGYLNTETAFLGAIVAGNGINYGLIYLARVGQLRRAGVALADACRDGAREAVRGTLLASLGTAVSFGTLVIAANRGFRHFGIIGGVGMLLCWAATFTLLPAILLTMERILPFRPRHAAAGSAGHPSWVRALERVFARPRVVIGAFAVLTAASAAVFLWRLPNAMELDLNNLTNEVKGNPELVRDNDRANTSLGASIAGVVALLPSEADAEAYCAAVRRRAEEPRFRGLVQGCETLATVVPSDQEAKLRVIADIRRRLSDAVLDELPPRAAARAREIRAELAAQRPVTVAEAPPSLVDRFRENDGSVGRLAFVRARPDAKLELGPNLRRFAAAVRDVPVDGRRFDAAGETVVVADLLANIEREGPITTVLSFVGVCLLVLVFFRAGRGAVQALLSLTVGVALMAGIAAATDLKINFFNFVVYPITFGIAVDYGANLLSRIRLRRAVIPALVEVGPAVVLCSWTTIIGYGSLLFSLNRALRSFGWYAMLGEWTTLVTALALLPALVLASGRSRAAAEAEASARKGQAAAASRPQEIRNG